MTPSTTGSPVAGPGATESSRVGALGVRADLLTAGGALALVAVATAVGMYLNRPDSGVRIWAGAPPLYGRWLPHLGLGTAFAVLLAVAVAAWGPGLAERLRWRVALGVGYLAAVTWTFTLAMVDGWSRGFADRLTTPAEYLSEVPGITDIGVMLAEFTDRILVGSPDNWAVHVSGHPPGATLVFVWLDRIGLSGPVAASSVCVLVGCLTAIAVPVAVRALGDPDAARAVLGFVVLFPGAVWVGVSADGLFAGVTSVGIALLALACGARGVRRAVLAGAAGAVLGFSIFLSYGFVLLGIIALAVVAYRRAWSVLLIAGACALVVVGVFTLAGFWWLDGYHLVVRRYYQDLGRQRPYAYWVWANLAALVLVVGPAAVAGVRRALGAVRSGWGAVPLLVASALIVVAVADLSGLSKAETERIWLPFAVWLLPAVTLLPTACRRRWLLAQAATALAVNHLLLTVW